MNVPSAFTPSSSPPTQDTADYVKPVTFSIEYSLEDPDYGPMLDDGWPTTLRVSVCPGTQGSSSGTYPTPALASSQKPRLCEGTCEFFSCYTFPPPAPQSPSMSFPPSS